MHIRDFKGLADNELSDKQQELFTAFLKDDVDIGLGTLRVTHVKAALYLAQQHANVKRLKIWHPQCERIKLMMISSESDDWLPKSKVLEIAALSWYAWGVLSEQSANYGEHLITLAIFLFGYVCDRSSSRESHSDEKCSELAIHSLPYMRDWFTTSFCRDTDPMYSSYLLWLEQLKFENESLSHLVNGSKGSEEETSSLMHRRVERLRKAEKREEDWLVEWLRTSIYHFPDLSYSPFQAVFLQNPLPHAACPGQITNRTKFTKRASGANNAAVAVRISRRSRLTQRKREKSSK